MTREPVGHEWLAELRDKFAEEFAEPPSSTSIFTPDGTVIVSDTAGNSVSGRNWEEALANFERAKAEHERAKA
ncbi:hypothetical protein EPK99_06580 [Neorhizobium lilium]|uniref:Uncharacterized protein n=1 Tax=Neorhizobium lilium TaxID=2503024 RepID=A0A444LGY1_9HYPH|nr:hypothetical protein [Neorhizobium lilium]RWX78291.1 hypothetical protein EPK99_06580 [Neorhizobium lilium]